MQLWDAFHAPSWAEKAFNKSFDNLNLGYIDLYLMHSAEAYQRVLKGPNFSPDDVDSHIFEPKDKNGSTNNQFSLYPFHDISTITYTFFHFVAGNILLDDIDYVDTWRAMEKLLDSGRVRSIGISNFDVEQTQRILSNGKIVPVTNQVECHPYKNQLDLIKFSAEKNITITAYAPLGHPQTPGDKNAPLSNPIIADLAKKYNRTTAQIILRYTVRYLLHFSFKNTNK